MKERKTKKRRELTLTNGEPKRKRTPQEIAEDRANRMSHDRKCNSIIRNLRFEALRLKEKQSEKKEDKEKEIILFEDMIPKYSLHKVTV